MRPSSRFSFRSLFRRDALLRLFAGLRFRLLLLVLLALVPALILVIRTAHEQRRLAAVQVQEDALRIARVTATNQQRIVDAAHQLLMTMADIPAVGDVDPDVCGAYLARALARYPHYSGLGVSDREGNVLCADDPGRRGGNIGRDSLVQIVFETNDFALGDYRVSSLGRAVLGFGYPLLDETRRTQRMLFTSIDLTWLNQMVSDSLMPAGSILALADRHGTVIARVPDPEHWVGRPLPEAALARTIADRQGEGTVEARGEDGVPRLYAFTALRQRQENYLYVSVSIPTSVAYAQVNQLLQRSLLWLGLVAVLALTTAWVSAEWFLVRRVEALLKVTARLADGDLSARTGVAYGVGELSQLAHSFDRMVDALQQREAERERAQEQAQHEAQRWASLANAATRLYARLDLQAVLAAICEEAALALHCPAAAVRLREGGADLPALAAGYGLPLGALNQAPPECQLAAAQPARPGDPIVLCPKGGQRDPCRLGTNGGSGLRAVAGVQMEGNGRLIGTLCVYAGDQVGRLAAEDLVLLKGLAAQAALAISNARLYETLRREEQIRSGLLHKIISAQEDERMRIARELHDETSQSLVTLMVGLDHAGMLLADNPQKAAQYVRTARSVAEGMIDDIHRLIEDLRPAVLDLLGLESAIIWYGEQRLSPLGITLHLSGDRLEHDLPVPTKTALFRVVQEALTNVVRHAQASEAHVRLAYEKDSLLLQVADDGLGFDPSLWTAERHFGLLGMQERVNVLGGEFRLQTTPGCGTMVEVRVPLPHKEAIHEEHPRTDGGRPHTAAPGTAGVSGEL